MFQDLDSVCAEYGLSGAETSAMRAVFEFRHIGGDRPALDAEPLVEKGAHPIGALMAVHVLQHDCRAARKQLAAQAESLCHV